MFDTEKFKRLMKTHPLSGKPVTQFNVVVGAELHQGTISKLLAGTTVNPNLDTLERLAKFFYGDVYKITEFIDGKDPDMMRYAIPQPGSMTVSKKAAKVSKK